ncbi:hypothetical protein MKX01_030616 [Papaver californicum]|nr:hypothetical protein MKX01_030616 [Papaver californicum]
MDPVIVAETVPYLSLFSAVSYGIASMAMVFINKAVLMQYSHSMTLLFLQQLATTLLIHFAPVMGGQHSYVYRLEETYTTCCLGIWIFLWKGEASNTGVSLSSITAFGVIIAALGDLSFDLFGYTMALTSVFFQTMYLVLVEKSGAEDGLSSVELMFYNGFLSLPFLLFLIIATGEFPNSVYLLFDKAISFSFLMVLLLSLVMGIVLYFTMFLCTIVNSALTTTIVGVLKGVGSTTLGFILLGGVQVHALNVTGLVINMAGGVCNRRRQLLSSPGPSEEHIMVYPVKVRDSCLQEEEAILSANTRWKELGQF